MYTMKIWHISFLLRIKVILRNSMDMILGTIVSDHLGKKDVLCCVL